MLEGKPAMVTFRVGRELEELAPAGLEQRHLSGAQGEGRAVDLHDEAAAVQEDELVVGLPAGATGTAGRVDDGAGPEAPGGGRETVNGRQATVKRIHCPLRGDRTC